MTQHILSLSYGKDSLACLGAIELLGWPLDRIIHAEIWATDTIPADLPPMVEFKKRADEIIRQRWGIEVEHICARDRDGSKLTYEKIFYRVPNRKSDDGFEDGTFAGFPYTKGAWCNDRLKTNPLDNASEMVPPRRSTGSRCRKESGAIRCSRPEQSTGPHLRFPNLSPTGQLVYRPQAKGFLLAPLHKERIQILCSTSA